MLLSLTLLLQPSAVVAQNAGVKSVVVELHDDRFEPAQLTVSPGTEVVFRNVGREGHWPASDSHPTHARFDGSSLDQHCGTGAATSFDACGSIPSGGVWSFVFEKTGSFGYHDHLWPHLRGEIIVSSSNSGPAGQHWLSRVAGIVRGTFSAITGLFTAGAEDSHAAAGDESHVGHHALSDRYERLVLDTNPREAIRALEADAARDSSVFALCHDFLHAIGRTAFSKYGSFRDAATFQSDFCNSGYVHGIFEAYFRTADAPLAGLADQCQEYASNTGRPFDLWQCHHGVGHGFMYLTGGDLDESLTLCEQSLGPDAGASCRNGVFMEVFNREVLARERAFVNPDDPFQTCSSRRVAQEACYLYVPTYLSQTRGMDFLEIFRECIRAEPGYVSSCLEGAGGEAIKRHMNDSAAMFALCRQAGTPAHQNSCFVGLVGAYMSQEGSFTAGQRLCAQAPLDVRDVCDSTIYARKWLFDDGSSRNDP